MHILLTLLIIVSSILTVKGELKVSTIYLKRTIEQLANEKCTSECYEKIEGCREFHNHLVICETLKKIVYTENYNSCFNECKNSKPRESLIACGYYCIHSTYKNEGINDPDDFFNDFIDSLSK